MNLVPRPAEKLREDALRIWHAGVAGVEPRRLLAETVHVDGDWLLIGDEEIHFPDVRRIAVVGGGKAGAGMVLGLEQALGPATCERIALAGLVCVPADCIVPTTRIELVAGRPATVNEPTTAGVVAAERMLKLVGELGPDDVCVCLLSGGGSALLPAPIDGFSLADKLELTRLLSAAGASIDQLNAVRRELSRVKGGGLAQACKAGLLATLVISDVPGDDMATIASGPTVPCEPNPAAAIDVIFRLGLGSEPAAQRALELLARGGKRQGAMQPPPSHLRLMHAVIGNNAAAVDAAGIEAERLGYSHAMLSSTVGA